MDIGELKWAAGFFDGEGHTRANEIHDGIWQLRVDITQADRRVLDRFQRAVMTGTVYGPYPPRVLGHQHRFQFAAVGSHAQAVIAMIWGTLDVVKREQAAAAMRLVKSTAARNREGLRPACRRGHLFDDANTRLYAQGEKHWISRYCRKCQAMKQSRYRARQRDLARLLAANADLDIAWA